MKSRCSSCDTLELPVDAALVPHVGSAVLCWCRFNRYADRMRDTLGYEATAAVEVEQALRTAGWPMIPGVVGWQPGTPNGEEIETGIGPDPELLLGWWVTKPWGLDVAVAWAAEGHTYWQQGRLHPRFWNVMKRGALDDEWRVAGDAVRLTAGRRVWVEFLRLP